MFDFKQYLSDEYRFCLKNAVYTRIETPEPTKFNVTAEDSLNYEIMDQTLVLQFERHVHFTPEALFDLRVIFEMELYIKNEGLCEDAKNINWSKVLIENPNAYLGNVLSRASNLVAAITSSYGQQPLITPPSFISH